MAALCWTFPGKQTLGGNVIGPVASKFKETGKHLCLKNIVRAGIKYIVIP